MNLELTQSQVWLVSRGLLWLTSQQGADAIFDEFPGANVEAMAEDVAKVLAKMETALASGDTQLKKDTT